MLTEKKPGWHSKPVRFPVGVLDAEPVPVGVGECVAWAVGEGEGPPNPLNGHNCPT